MLSAKHLVLISIFTLLASLSANAAAPFVEKKTLGLAGAKKIAAAAEVEAAKNALNVVIAIVDNGGHLIYFQRNDSAPTGSIDVAQGKARTAAAFGRPTKVFDDMASTRPSLATLSNAVLLEGGVPVIVAGQVVGAVGVSGASSQQDAQIAEVGIAALEK
jgi:glc operon protein GlcG